MNRSATNEQRDTSILVPSRLGKSVVEAKNKQSGAESKPVLFVSVIIPVFNDLDNLTLCLKALEKQSYPEDQYEVIVVDNASTQDIKSLSGQFTKTRYFSELKPGSYPARNKGLAAARGEIIAFTDSDCIPEPDWIEQGVRSLEADGSVDIAGGKIDFYFRESGNPNACELYDSTIYLQQEFIIRKKHFCATANLFTYKRVLEEVGPFNSELKSGGDVEWGLRAYRMGYNLVYGEQAAISHPARYSLPQLVNKTKRIMGGNYDRGYLLGTLTPLMALKQIFLTMGSVPVRKKGAVLGISFLMVWVSLKEMLLLCCLRKSSRR